MGSDPVKTLLDCRFGKRCHEETPCAWHAHAAEVSALKGQLAEAKASLKDLHHVATLAQAKWRMSDKALAQRDEEIQTMRDQAECADVLLNQQAEMIRALTEHGWRVVRVFSHGKPGGWQWPIPYGPEVSVPGSHNEPPPWPEECSRALRELEGGR